MTLSCCIIGFYSFYLKGVRNDCTMTYMYQQPNYIKVEMNKAVVEKFPSYNLFVYKEGFDSSARLKGYPIIFVPGNAGSYKQVRSVASIANSMMTDGQVSTELDFFTVDFNEEKAGVFGPVLGKQVEFLLQVMQTVKDAYAGRGLVSCTIIGHSVGGVVSRGLLLHPSFNPQCLDLLITLSAPLKEPVLSFDAAMTQFYHDMNVEWRRQRSMLPRNQSRISHVNHLSIAGGFSDVMVRSQLAMFTDQDTGDDIDLSVVSTAVNDVWLSIDHLCIVWCRELKVKLARLLFDVVNSGQRDPVVKRDIIRYHVMDGSRGKVYTPSHAVPKRIVYPLTGEWIHVEERIFRWTSKKRILEPVFFLVKLVPKTTVVLWVDGETRIEWISACNISGSLLKKDDREVRVCDSGVSLSHLTRILPSSSTTMSKKRRRVMVKTSSEAILSLGVTHLNVALTPTTDFVSLVVERFSYSKRNKAVVLPSIIQSLTMLFSFITVLDIPVSDESSYFNLSLVGMEQVWHTYAVQVIRGSCYAVAEESKTRELSHFNLPWSLEDVFTTMNHEEPKQFKKRNRVMTTLLLRVNVPKPGLEETRSPSLELLVDPDCSYQIRIKLDLQAMLGHVFRFYYQYLIPFVFAIFVSVLRLQMTLSKSSRHLIPTEDDEEEDGQENIPNKQILFHDGIERILRRKFFSVCGIIPFFPFIMTRLANYLFTKETIDSSWLLRSFMSLEMKNLNDLQFVLLFYVIFMSSYSISYLTAVVMQGLLGVTTQMVLFVKKLFSRHRQIYETKWTLAWSPIFIGLFLMLVSLATTSNIGITAAALIHSIKLLKLSVKSWQAFDRKGLTPETTIIHYQTTILWLLLLSCAASAPLTMYWLSLGCPVFFSIWPLKHQVILSDPQLIPCLIILISMMIIWQKKPFYHEQKDMKPCLCRTVLFCMSLFSAIFGHNLHFIPYLTCLILFSQSIMTVNATDFSTIFEPNEGSIDHDHQE